jgi:ubiquinone/menaquinone biosynthesis C-methylase UbiE
MCVCVCVAKTRAEHGHHWFGTDISRAMLEVAEERDVEGDLALSDMGQGLPLRAAMFDGAISISAVQVRACRCMFTGRGGSTRGSGADGGEG